MRWRLLLLSPFLLLLILFALTNTVAVPIGLWPTGITIQAPLSAAILIASAIAFAAGAVLSWFGSLPHRRRGRRAETRLATVQAQLDACRAQQAAAPRPASLPPPA